MNYKKDKAISLRKLGRSYSQIGNELNVAKSTLSYWLSNLKIKAELLNKINRRATMVSREALIKRNREQTNIAALRHKKIRKSAKLDVQNRLSDKLFLSGVNLYWAEGYKKGAFGSKWKGVDFANSDPSLIRLMMKFFIKICKVDKSRIRIQIIAHSNVNIDDAVKFWSRVTGITKDQFTKTYYSPQGISKNPRKNRTLIHGTAHIRISDVTLFFTLIGWIEGLRLYFKV